MNLLWARPLFGERRFVPDDRRIRDYLDSAAGVSESVASLAAKLGVSRGRCRQVLEQLVQEGVMRRRDYIDIEPMYSRYPPR